VAKPNYHQAKKTERTGAQGAPAGESSNVGPLARAFRTPRRARWKRRPLRAIRLPGAQREPARFSAAARQERMDRLRRDRAAALALRVAFPTVQHLRLELKFESTTSSTPTLQSHVLHPPARAFFEFPCPYADCDGQFDLTSAVKAALAIRRISSRGTGVLRPACTGLRFKATLSVAPDLHGHGNVSRRT